MLIAAIMMITGGEAKELDKLGRADRYLITRAIILAAQAARHEGRPHPLAHDVAVRLLAMRKEEALSPKRQERAEDMGQSMLAFTQGLRGKLFNREGAAWPDADVTLVEMGTLAKDGYEDALALAFSGLMDHVQGIGEATQGSGRHTIFLADEGHILTKNPLLGPKITKGTKMWRKLYIWFWLATQNLEDLPGEMSRVLSMCEFWLLLTMGKKEIRHVARFKTLTREQRLMIESARKEPTKYTEGVILSTEQQVLFRNVPPPLALAFAMTEGHEKAERRRIMKAHGCTELEAAFHVARRIASRDLLAKKASQGTGADSKATGNQARPADEEAPDAEDADAFDDDIALHAGEPV
jgi:conjugative transfer ATPase